jgi:spore germination cell wall hydrolase CwlJ-like protein
MYKYILLVSLTVLFITSMSYAEDNKEYNCLVEAIYFEARSENKIGQLAVANVILERVKREEHPDTICKVVHEWKYYPKLHRCSFSYYCDGKEEVMSEKEAVVKAMNVATLALRGAIVEDLWGATHYHTRHVQPYWSTDMIYVGSIGEHLFYASIY